MPYSSPSSRRLVAVVVLPLVATYVSALNITVPAALPDNAQPLSTTLVSFSIEQDRWPDWTGIDARNNFTFNALWNYAELTGSPPSIRVGANSADRTFWSPTESLNEDSFPTPNSVNPYPEATHIVVGNNFYNLSKYLPPGTRITWGVNLAANNVTNAVNMARAITGSFSDPAVIASDIILDRIEIGNEPDLYAHNNLRPSNYSVKEYVSEWQANADPVVQALGIRGRSGLFTIQGAAFANQGFTPREIFNLGILNSTGGKAISTISQHHYSGQSCKGGNVPLNSFMNKTAIRGNLSVFEPDIKATRAQGLDYVLGETNSIACHGAPGVSDSAGAALWVVDYTLHAATLGIKEAYFHEGVGYKYNFFQPVSLNRSIDDGSSVNPPTPPRVMPIYYGGLFINSFIGNTGSSEFVELDVNHTYVTGYAVYEQGHLARVAFVNLQPYLSNTRGARPSVNIRIDFISPADSPSLAQLLNGQTVSAEHLLLRYADDKANLTFGRRSYETPDALPDSPTEAVDGFLLSGKPLALPASEAVLISFAPPSSPAGAGPSGSTPVSRNGTVIVAGVISGVVGAALCVGGVWYLRRRFSVRKL
ncbi:hypothetical protein BD309DRAFT_948782 [Dichomitus squalens]|uniref:Uncharacterized protein n=1 Tax=Dichomitus squalens TaxID=114155 RepID=A0A4Q9P767_9APHY|nr:hypothetical protein BD309DRAFT_948782 [Dichomitus squalens]TBU57804.1 hypothetical protein BD310DRAFT_928390 [Dichomitus squalens]